MERRYLKTDDDRRAAHAALARTFAAYELGPRVVDELPWQQLGAGNVDGLVATLSDLAFMDRAYRQGQAELRQLWAKAEQAGYRVVDAYRSIVDDPAGNPDMAWEVARMVTDAGYPVQAARLHRHLVDSYRQRVDETAHRRLPSALVNLGAALMGQGELIAAEAPLREAIALSRGRNDRAALQGRSEISRYACAISAISTTRPRCSRKKKRLAAAVATPAGYRPISATVRSCCVSAATIAAPWR